MSLRRSLTSLAVLVIAMATLAPVAAARHTRVANGAFLVRLDRPDAAGDLGIRTDLYLLDADGGRRQITDDSAWEFGAKFAADGQTIVFSSNRDGPGSIYTMRVDGSR